MRIFGVLSSHEKSHILEHAGREPEMRQIGQEKEISQTDAPKKVFRATIDVLCVIFLFHRM
jgi:hypothetical protein